jgi:hypothetical protein
MAITNSTYGREFTPDVDRPGVRVGRLLTRVELAPYDLRSATSVVVDSGQHVPDDACRH